MDVSLDYAARRYVMVLKRTSTDGESEFGDVHVVCLFGLCRLHQSAHHQPMHKRRTQSYSLRCLTIASSTKS